MLHGFFNGSHIANWHKDRTNTLWIWYWYTYSPLSKQSIIIQLGECFKYSWWSIHTDRGCLQGKLFIHCQWEKSFPVWVHKHFWPINKWVQAKGSTTMHGGLWGPERTRHSHIFTKGTVKLTVPHFSSLTRQIWCSCNSVERSASEWNILHFYK